MLFVTEEVHQLVSKSAAGVAETTLPAVGIAGTTLLAVGVAGTSLLTTGVAQTTLPAIGITDTTLPAAPGIEFVLSLLYNVEGNVAQVPLYIASDPENVLVSFRGDRPSRLKKTKDQEKLRIF